MDKFVFGDGTTPTLYYGVQSNTDSELSAADLLKPINIWFKERNNGHKHRIISNGSQRQWRNKHGRSTQLAMSVLGKTKNGKLGILSK